MNSEELKNILEQVQSGSLSTDDAVNRLKTLPFENLGYANVDHHRGVRAHANEVIFCEGKHISHIVGIVENMLSHNAENIIGTRASEEVYNELLKLTDKIIYHKHARIVQINPKEIRKTGKKILVVSGGTADIPVADEAAVTAEILGNPVIRAYDVGVAGLHRLLSKMDDIHSANVIIAAAGMEGALPSVIGGLTDKPVIALPTSVGYGASFGGVAALLAMLNSCASGIGVVNIDNGFGAGYLASTINQL